MPPSRRSIARRCSLATLAFALAVPDAAAQSEADEAVGMPWMVHTGGSAAVPGWRGLIDPGSLSESHAALAGQCEACHTPHRGVDDGKCAACHAATP